MRQGDEPQLEAALERESVNCEDELQRTPLHVAAAAGEVNATLALLDAGAELSRDVQGRGPLHSAAEAGHAELCALLLGSVGAYSEMADTMGRTALHIAARAEQLGPAAVLLDHGAHTTARDSEDRTPLHYSARSDGAVEVSRLLLHRGADPTAADVAGLHPLHIACLENQEQTVAVLQVAGADLWAMDRAGWNPLMHAAAGGFEPLVTTLAFSVLRPQQFPAPDPAIAIHQESEGLLGIPGWVLALASVSLCACLVMSEAMRRLGACSGVCRSSCLPCCRKRGAQAAQAT